MDSAVVSAWQKRDPFGRRRPGSSPLARGDDVNQVIWRRGLLFRELLERMHDNCPTFPR